MIIIMTITIILKPTTGNNLKSWYTEIYVKEKSLYGIVVGEFVI